MSVKSYAEAVMALSPVAYWRCGEASGNLVDSSGNGNTATAHGTPTYGVDGLISGDGDKAISFPGASASYFEAPNSASLNVADTFTVLGWCKPAAIGLQRFITQVANGYDVSMDASGYLQLAKDAVSFLVISTASPFVVGQRSMWAITKNGVNSAKCYMDGVLVSPADASGMSCTGPGGVTEIGRNATGGGSPVDGVLDEIALFDRALTAAQLASLYADGIAPNQPLTTTVVWREPTPPHAAIYSSAVSACKASFRLRGMGSASFLLPRGDSNEAGIAALLARCVPMVTVERSDGFLPFVGFPTHPSFKSSDTHSAFQLADHTIRLNQAKTRILAEVRQASGQFIIDEIGEMDRRAEPPIYLDLRNVKSGLPASLALSGQGGDSLLRELEKQTGHDAFFTYRISPQRVLTQLNWGGPQGVDRRSEDAWIDGIHLADVQYAYDYLRTPGSVTTVGGTGALTGRSSATAQTATRGASIGSAAETAGVARLGFGGSRIDYAQKITDTQILAQRSKAVLLEPQNAAVQWEGSLIEAHADMSRVGVGDIRVIRSESAYMGQAVAGVARIVGLELNADSGVHKFIAVEAS